MRYPASEELAIIQLVVKSHVSVRRTLEKLGILRAAFDLRCDPYRAGGPEALEYCRPRSIRIWRSIKHDRGRK